MIHDPGAFDPDGSNMIFELVSPLGNECDPIAGYMEPTAQNLVWLDPATGVFLWDYPPSTGLWTIAIRASSWDGNSLIGQVTRDMTICVDAFEVGLTEDPLQTGWGIAPRVAEDRIWITNHTSSPLNVEVVSVTGTVVLRMRVPDGMNEMDVSTLASGAYFIRASDGAGKIRSGRFVKP